MAEHHDFKIPVYPHVIERTEEDLCAARLLLGRLQERCDDLVYSFGECKPEEKTNMADKAISLLGEMSDIFHFMTPSLESRESFLNNIRREAVDEIISARGRLENAA
jgi:hypothetical protein